MGHPKSRVAIILGVHHSKIIRLIDIGYLFDDYVPFDEEEDRVHLYQNFEWLYEEDVLEDMLYKAFDGTSVIIDRGLPDMVGVGNYVRETYGNLFGYIKQRDFTRVIDNFYVKCTKCKEVDGLNNWYEDSSKGWGLYYECKNCRGVINTDYFDRNPDKVFAGNNRRREMSDSLPGDYVEWDWVSVMGEYDWRCSLSGVIADVTVDHFIPINSGHGGTYVGNLIPLSRSLNCSKKARNPFKWFETYLVSDKVCSENWQHVVSYLARENGLTTQEYRLFVDWCFDNQRTVDEVKADPRYSIEIWREATGRQFPLPSYVGLVEIGNRLNFEGEAIA